MRLGIFAKTFSGPTLADVLRSVSRAGYHSVQLNLSSAGLPSMPDALSEEDVRQIVDAIKATQIRIEALSGTHVERAPGKLFPWRLEGSLPHDGGSSSRG